MDKEGDVIISRGGGGSNKKQWRRNEPPRCQCTLQERSELVEKMEANRYMNMKGGWYAAESAAVTSEGGQKLLN